MVSGVPIVLGCCGSIYLDNRRVTFARGKTGIDRSLPLWPETVCALKVLPRQNERVFNTSKGNAWVRASKKADEGSRVKYTRDHALSKEFSKLLKKQVSRRRRALASIPSGEQLRPWRRGPVILLRCRGCLAC